MKQLNNIQSAIWLLGGLMMVAGVGCFVLMWHQPIVCWVYFLGASMFSSMQLMQTYEGPDPTIRRLKRLQSVAGLCFVLAGMLMADNVYMFFRPLFSNSIDYITYVFNKWVVLLLVAAVIEVYTVHRLDHELRKKN